MEDVGARIVFDGREIPIRPSDSIASALMRAGILSLRRSRRGFPRGIYCGIGVCQECLVSPETGDPVRACVTVARPGMRIRAAG